jgi:hypothetical protein
MLWAPWEQEGGKDGKDILDTSLTSSSFQVMKWKIVLIFSQSHKLTKATK